MPDRQAVINQLLNRDRLSAEHQVFLKHEIAASITAAQGALVTAEVEQDSNPSDSNAAAVEAARVALEETWAAAAPHLVTLRFEGLPPDEFEELIGEHPATSEQEEKAGGSLRWNPKTFPSALLAATCVDPGFASADEAHEVFYGPKARFSKGETSQILTEVLLTCEGTREVADWGKGSGETAG